MRTRVIVKVLKEAFSGLFGLWVSSRIRVESHSDAKLSRVTPSPAPELTSFTSESAWSHTHTQAHTHTHTSTNACTHALTHVHTHILFIYVVFPTENEMHQRDATFRQNVSVPVSDDVNDFSTCRGSAPRRHLPAKRQPTGS